MLTDRLMIAWVSVLCGAAILIAVAVCIFGE